MLVLLEPWHGSTATSKRNAVPSRNKLTCMVAATALFDLGPTLMETCDQGPGKVYQATRYRDGVLIAFLISCPIRMRNLASIEVGQHLIWDGTNASCISPRRRPRPGDPTPRPSRPTSLHTSIARCTFTARRCIRMHWPRAQSRATTSGWTAGATYEQPGDSAADRAVHRPSLRQAYLASPVPALRRDRAGRFRPDEIGIAHDLLGHADLRTTRKHYIQANGMVAHVLVQAVIAARRRAAAARESAGA